MDSKVFFDLSYGLFVLSTLDGTRPTGCTVNTAFQTTSDPATMTICVGHDHFTNDCIKKTGRVVVNILSEGVSMDTIAGFGFRTGRDCDKFAGVAHASTPEGLPILTEGICGWLSCKVRTSVELDTHTLFVLDVVDAQRVAAGQKPMTYGEYRRRKNEKAPAPSGKWVCTICGYEYDGAQGPFEALPEDWKCPLCGAAKALFELR